MEEKVQDDHIFLAPSLFTFLSRPFFYTEMKKEFSRIEVKNLGYDLIFFLEGDLSYSFLFLFCVKITKMWFLYQ